MVLKLGLKYIDLGDIVYILNCGVESVLIMDNLFSIIVLTIFHILMIQILYPLLRVLLTYKALQSIVLIPKIYTSINNSKEKVIELYFLPYSSKTKLNQMLFSLLKTNILL